MKEILATIYFILSLLFLFVLIFIVFPWIITVIWFCISTDQTLKHMLSIPNIMMYVLLLVLYIEILLFNVVSMKCSFYLMDGAKISYKEKQVLFLIILSIILVIILIFILPFFDNFTIF